jgi:hypothetical protein
MFLSIFAGFDQLECGRFVTCGQTAGLDQRSRKPELARQCVKFSAHRLQAALTRRTTTTDFASI